MKLYFARKINVISPVRLFVLACLTVVSMLSLNPASAQDAGTFTPAPLIGRATPQQLAEARMLYLRHNVKPMLEDFMPFVVNPQLKPVKGAKYGRIADDAPAVPTASVVTSTEQTVDATLPDYKLNAATGYPAQATPNNTDVIWSHDEEYLIFASNVTGYYHLYAMLASGGPIAYDSSKNPIFVEQLTGLTVATANTNDRYPSLLAPSDNSIAFCSDTAGDGVYHLVVAPVVSTSTGLSINQAQDIFLAPNLQVRHPFYAGDYIYFSGRLAEAGAAYNIYQVTVDTDLVTQFTGPTVGEAGLDEDNPSLSGFGWLAWDSTASSYTSTPQPQAPNAPVTATGVASYRSIWSCLPSGVGVEQLTTAANYNNEHPQWTTGSSNDFVGAKTGSVAGAEDLFFDSDRTAPLPIGNTGPGNSIYYYPAWSNLSDGTQLTGSVAAGGYTLSVPAEALTYYVAGTVVEINQGQANEEYNTVLSVTTTPPTLNFPDIKTPTENTTFKYPHSIGETVQIVGAALPGVPITEAVAGDTVEVNTSNPTHLFSDTQAAVSSLVPSYISVAYISNRYLIDNISDNPLAISSLSNQSTVNSVLTDAAAYGDTTIDQEPVSLPTVPANSQTGATEVLVSRLTDIDPPSIITFNQANSEIVHVFPGDVQSYSSTSGTTTHYVPAGQDATFVVRLSDRQAGVGAAWLQIKDPESANQDSTGLEHKVYTQYKSTEFHNDKNEATSLFGLVGSSANDPYYGAAVAGYNGINPIILGNQVLTGVGGTISGYATTVKTAIVAAATTVVVTNLGSLAVGDAVDIGSGGIDAEVVAITAIATTTNTLTITATLNPHAAGEIVEVMIGAATITATDNNPPGFSLPIDSNSITPTGGSPVTQFNVGDEIGVYAPGTEHTLSSAIEIAEITSIPNNTTLDIDYGLTEVPATSDNHVGLYTILKGDIIERISTTQFDPLGQEVDCQAIDTSLTANDDVSGLDLISGLATSYLIPKYTPGIEDAEYFPGVADDAAGNSIWLQLHPMPAADQDKNGGVLYYATWNTPLDPSDYYIDVIAEDASTSANWRIFDDVWGFTTQSFQAQNSILLVNDYALPQKFFTLASRSNGTVGSDNIPENLFGTESYWTDLSNNVAGWQSYYSSPDSSFDLAKRDAAPTVVLPLIAVQYVYINNSPVLTQVAKITSGQFTGQGTIGTDGENPQNVYGAGYFPSYANGLGVNSYYDQEQTQINQSGIVPEATPLANSQKYDMWRILSRGPVPLTIMESYGSKTMVQPHYPYSTTNGPVVNQVAPSCVVWLSPYSGDVFAGPGTIIDSTTQNNLDTFLQQGGRLHIEGKDIGFALTANGTSTNSFYNTDLNNFGAGAGPLTAFIGDDAGDTSAVTTLNGSLNQSDSISNDAFINFYWNGDNDAAGVYHLGFAFPTDGNGNYSWTAPGSSPTTIGHNSLYLNDTTARTDTSLDCFDPPFTYIDTFNTNGKTELVGSGASDREVFYRSAATIGQPYYGSIVSYSSFGMATVSQEVSNLTIGPGNNYVSRNKRTNLIHDIVCTLRTGAFTGYVTSTAGSLPIPNAVVYAIPESINGYLAPATAVYTATTDANGQYNIEGVIPGRYVISGYKQGYDFQHNATGIDVHGGESNTYKLNLSLGGNGEINAYVIANDTSALSVDLAAKATSIYVINGIPFSTGQIITVGVGATDAETATILAVNGDMLTVAALSNAHKAGEVVTATPATLTAAVAAGATVLPVSSLTPFSAGQSIVLDYGYADSEIVKVTGVNAGGADTNPYLSVTAVVNAHASGEWVKTSIPGVTVTPAEVEGGVAPAAMLTSSPAGVASFSPVESGIYSVTATALGYTTGSITDVQVAQGNTASAVVEITPIPASVSGLVYVQGTLSSTELTSPIGAGVSSLPVYGLGQITAGQTLIIDPALTTAETATVLAVKAGTSPTVTLTGPTTLAHSNGATVTGATAVSGATVTLTNSAGTPLIPPTGYTFSTTTANDGTYSISFPGGSIPITTALFEIASASQYQTSGPVSVGALNSTEVYLGVNIPLVYEPLPTTAPTISPDGGASLTSTSVTLADTQSGAVIYYTTDGQAPISSNEDTLVYSTPITVSATETITAMALAPNALDSPTVSATFVIGQPTTSPTISPNGGIFFNSETVTLGDTQANSTIYYTVNPATVLTVAVGPGATTLNVSSVSGLTAGQFVTVDAGTGSAETVSIVSVSGGANPAIVVTPVTNAHNPGAAIGLNNTPTVGGNGVLTYNGPITVSGPETINAIAVATGYTVSTPVVSATFMVYQAVPAPHISPAAGAYPTAQTVAITDTLPGATIYYSINGSKTENTYTGPITVSTSESITAFATFTGFPASSTVTSQFVIGQTVPTPVISPTSGDFGLGTLISISENQSGTSIYYTTDGQLPVIGNSDTTLYSAPFALAGAETVTAIATEAGYLPSASTSTAYTVGAPAVTPTFTPSGGQYTTPVAVTLADAQAGTSIYYTTDGSVPSQSSQLYNGPITVGSSETINAIAFVSGYANSSVASATYTIATVLPTPTFSPAGGAYTFTQPVTISDTTAGVKIYYTLDGSTPTTLSALYSSPISVSASETINAIAVETGFTNSAVATATYAINANTPAPVITPGSTTFAATEQVTITDSLAGSTIYYTLDGTVPTVKSLTYGGPITISKTATVTAIAVAPGYDASTSASEVYTYNPPVIASFPAGLQMISLPESYPSVSLDSIFGYTGVKLAVWNPAASVYAVTPVAPADQIVSGQGYWVRFPQAVTVTLAGMPTPTNAPFVISLKPGWNMIGDPFTSAVSLSDTTLNNSGTVEPYSQAAGSWLGSVVYGYNASGNAYAATSTLSPNQGYWIFAFQAVNMTVPVP